jgi:hypothetical protein
MKGPDVVGRIEQAQPLRLTQENRKPSETVATERTLARQASSQLLEGTP